MTLAKRYSCILEEPLLQTHEGLGQTLEMLAVLGYTPKELGITSIGPNTDQKGITLEDTSFILLRHGKDYSSVGLVPGPQGGYFAYHLRY